MKLDETIERLQEQAEIYEAAKQEEMFRLLDVAAQHLRDMRDYLTEALPDLKGGMFCHPDPELIEKIETLLNS